MSKLFSKKMNNCKDWKTMHNCCISKLFNIEPSVLWSKFGFVCQKDAECPSIMVGNGESWLCHFLELLGIELNSPNYCIKFFYNSPDIPTFYHSHASIHIRLTLAL